MTWSTASRQARGYGRQWESLRAQVLQRDCHICWCPRCQGGELRVTPADQVDHILSKAQGGSDDLSNLRAVNRECHVRVTQEQRGYTPKPRTGVDGWPVDE